MSSYHAGVNRKSKENREAGGVIVVGNWLRRWHLAHISSLQVPSDLRAFLPGALWFRGPNQT
jgi:hypothetical protein